MNYKTIHMKNTLLLSICLTAYTMMFAQTNPAITNWMINTNGTLGRHYVQGNSTPINDTMHANVQKVQYSANNVYISSSGIPAYIIGPYLDGNPAQATNNTWLFKVPLNPVKNTGTKTKTSLGTIGVFINGVPMYNALDAKSYQNKGDWNTDAVVAESAGFDCAKGHPSPIFVGGPPPQGQLAGGSYHHHQNPSAFNLDLKVVSNVCNLYLADGLYKIDSTQHSPLLGYAYDGYPIYGAYAYSDTNGTGGIRRMESSYHLRNITVRTQYADGTPVSAGPNVNSSYPLGMYAEDYEYIAGSGDLDEHNGRWCITPEYPQGTYAYFATVDSNWNSAYPYFIGPTYYGVKNGGEATSITESVQNYVGIEKPEMDNLSIVVYPNPAGDLVAIQMGSIINRNYTVQLFDMSGRMVQNTTLNKGSTIAYLDTRTLYNGNYILKITNGEELITRQITISK